MCRRGIKLVMWLNPFPIYRDMNGNKIKDGDVVTIHNVRQMKAGDRVLVRFDYLPEINLIRKTPVLYNPNCCKACRAKWSYIWDITELDEDEIEILGNIKENPELLPLEDIDK